MFARDELRINILDGFCDIELPANNCRLNNFQLARIVVENKARACSGTTASGSTSVSKKPESCTSCNPTE